MPTCVPPLIDGVQSGDALAILELCVGRGILPVNDEVCCVTPEQLSLHSKFRNIRSTFVATMQPDEHRQPLDIIFHAGKPSCLAYLLEVRRRRWL